MARATPNSVMLVTLAGMAAVLCGGLVVVVEYAKTEVKKHKASEMTPPPDQPAGPFADRIQKLARTEYAVTQRGHDDIANAGRYVATKDPGLYLDVVSGAVLFSSLDKLDAVIGFAEFAKSFDPAALVEVEAIMLGEKRLTVRSKAANSYLGWIDPGDNARARRYVINSSALHFIPAGEFEKHGLSQHRALFGQ